MENLALGSPKPVLGFHHSPEPGRLPLGLSLPIRKSSSFVSSRPRYRTAVFSLSSANSAKQGKDKIGVIRLFASVSSSATGARETTSVGVNPLPPTPPPSQFGSPLFWIGVGVGFSALFSLLASNLKKYAMQQAFKTMMGQMGSQSNTSPPAFSPGYPFPFTPPSTATPATSSRPTTSPQPAISLSPTASQDTVTVDVSAKKDEVTPAASLKEDVKIKTEPKRCAFVDVSPDDTLLNTPFEKVQEPTTSSKDTKFTDEATQNGTAQNGTWAGAGAGTGAGFGAGAGAGSGKAGPFLSVEALEKMLEDPTVQKMVYPYLPEEMRNPATFKWMVQNPVYRQQLQDMLNNMGGSSEWDNRMMDSLKNFDLSSPEVKQQFDQIGVTPEEVISKIMANPDVAMAFQNPRVQAAIMDCSQNPFNIAKYQNDKEVMDVFNKISELFPGLTGSP